MDNSLVFTFNHSEFLLLLEVELNLSLDWVLGTTDLSQLIIALLVVKSVCLLFVFELVTDGVHHPFFEVDIQLILESFPPVVLFSKESHTLLKVGRQEVLGNIETLKFVHSFYLLLSLHAGVFKCLILNFDPLNFSFDFLLPIAVFDLTAFVIFVLELPNLVEFLLFLHLQGGLVDALAQQHVQDWLHLLVVVEQIIVLDLGDLIDTSLLWHILWSRWSWLENVSLQFHFCLCWLFLALLSQKVGEVDINSCRWSWAQVVGTCCILRLLKLEQLCFDHLDLFLLALLFDALLFLLGWGQV